MFGWAVASSVTDLMAFLAGNESCLRSFHSKSESIGHTEFILCGKLRIPLDELVCSVYMVRIGLPTESGLATIPEASIPVSIVEIFFRYRKESIVSIPESILTPKINSFFYYLNYIIPLISSLSIKRNTYYY
jgi:hypothetical protein